MMTFCTLADVQEKVCPPGKRFTPKEGAEVQGQIEAAAAEIKTVIGARYSIKGGMPRDVAFFLRQLNMLGAVAKQSQGENELKAYDSRLGALDRMELPLPQIPKPDGKKAAAKKAAVKKAPQGGKE